VTVASDRRTRWQPAASAWRACRSNALSQGVRQIAVWLDQASVDRLVALRPAREHDNEVVRRALEAWSAVGSSVIPSLLTSLLTP